MRQSSEDRARYYRQLRDTIRTGFLPELTSAQAIDAAALVDRILVEFIVEEEAAAALSEEFGAGFDALLEPGAAGERAPVTPGRFDELRALAADVASRTAGSTDAGARALAQSLADVERGFLDRTDELRVAVIAEGGAGDGEHSTDACSMTNAQITEYLRRRLADSPDVVVERASVVPGGRSKETILVSLRGTAELPDEVILRKDRPVSLLQTRAAEEFAIVKAVHDFGGVPIPEPFFAEWDDHGLGRGTFLVMERVRGHKAGEFFPDLAAPTDHRTAIGRQLAAALARLHSMPLERLAATGLDETRSEVTEESIVATVEAISTRIGELTGPPSVNVALARQWLLEHVSAAAPTRRVCLLHGDFGFHNLLVEGARVTALVDWEAATIGPPARELAAAWPAATALMDWHDFVTAYVRAGGSREDADANAIVFYRLLSAFGGFMASRTGGHLFRTGAKRDLLTAHSGLDSHFRCARNLARTLADADACSP